MQEPRAFSEPPRRFQDVYDRLNRQQVRNMLQGLIDRGARIDPIAQFQPAGATPPEDVGENDVGGDVGRNP